MTLSFLRCVAGASGPAARSQYLRSRYKSRPFVFVGGGYLHSATRAVWRGIHQYIFHYFFTCILIWYFHIGYISICIYMEVYTSTRYARNYSYQCRNFPCYLARQAPFYLPRLNDAASRDNALGTYSSSQYSCEPSAFLRSEPNTCLPWMRKYVLLLRELPIRIPRLWFYPNNNEFAVD